MSATTRLSVVLPVHNGERYLSQALDSLFKQTFEDFEVIAVDDGSTDSTPTILADHARLDGRLHVVRQEHGGLVAALNYATSLVHGLYVARMDADDLADRERFGMQVDFLDQHPRVGVVGAAILVVDEHNRPLFPVKYATADAAIREALHAGTGFAHPVVMMRTARLKAAGGYRSAFVHAEDFDLWLRLSESCELANLPASLLRLRFHRGSVSLLHLQQQVVSMVGAEQSARLRRSGQSDSLAECPQVSLDAIIASGASRNSVLSRVLELSAARATFLALVGEADEALHLLHWATLTATGARLDRRARSKAKMVAALAWHRKASHLRSVAAAVSALLADPLFALPTAATRGWQLLR